MMAPEKRSTPEVQRVAAWLSTRWPSHVQPDDTLMLQLAEGLLGAARLSEEHRLGDDGSGSYPPNPATDRPQSRWRRVVGPWERA